MGDLSAKFFYEAQNNDKSTLEFIYDYYKKIVYDCLSKSKGFFLRSVDEDDYISAAFYGLYKAIKIFDPSKGNAFSSFAYPVIMNEIKTVNVRNSTLQKKFEENVVSLDNYMSITESDGGMKNLNTIRDVMDDEYYDSDAKLNADILLTKVKSLLSDRSFDMFTMLSLGYTHETIGKKYSITKEAVDKQLVNDRKYIKNLIKNSNKAHMNYLNNVSYDRYYLEMYDFLYNDKRKPLTDEEIKNEKEREILEKLNYIFCGVFNFDILYSRKVLDMTAEEVMEKLNINFARNYLYKKSERSKRAIDNFIKIADEIYFEAEFGVTFENLAKKYGISEDEVIFFYDLKNYLDGEDLPIVDGKPIFEKYSTYLNSNWDIMKKIHAEREIEK